MYSGYITDIKGIKVGHAQSQEGMTGCSVIICEEGATGGVDVRGSAPGTRETDLFKAEKMVDKVHAIVLSGGSAFGLDAASGVMKYLEEEGIGLDVGVTKVPIVSSAVIFDLNIGDYRIRPDFNMGYLAAKNARKDNILQGNVGCGMGATVGKILGPEKAMKSGLGSATVKVGNLLVSAMVAVNSFGDIYDFKDNKQIAGVYDYSNNKLLNTIDIMKEASREIGFNVKNTTIGIITTNAIITKAEGNKISQMAHNGFARTINPVHTMVDGDTIFTMGTNEIKADI
ncbi:MAG TPA: P1 family peptidase, partial [Tissierellaceae bacterium]|nr:P1 family peptidase [Tissierellaceae bacterium]